MKTNNDDTILLALENLRKMLKVSRAEALWMANNRKTAIAACEEIIKQQALEIRDLKLEAVKGFPGMADEQATRWIQELTSTVASQRDRHAAAQGQREEIAIEYLDNTDQVLSLIEKMFKAIGEGL